LEVPAEHSAYFQLSNFPDIVKLVDQQILKAYNSKNTNWETLFLDTKRHVVEGEDVYTHFADMSNAAATLLMQTMHMKGSLKFQTRKGQPVMPPVSDVDSDVEKQRLKEKNRKRGKGKGKAKSKEPTSHSPSPQSEVHSVPHRPSLHPPIPHATSRAPSPTTHDNPEPNDSSPPHTDTLQPHPTTTIVAQKPQSSQPSDVRHSKKRKRKHHEHSSASHSPARSAISRSSSRSSKRSRSPRVSQVKRARLASRIKREMIDNLTFARVDDLFHQARELTTRRVNRWNKDAALAKVFNGVGGSRNTYFRWQKDWLGPGAEKRAIWRDKDGATWRQFREDTLGQEGGEYSDEGDLSGGSQDESGDEENGNEDSDSEMECDDGEDVPPSSASSASRSRSELGHITTEEWDAEEEEEEGNDIVKLEEEDHTLRWQNNSIHPPLAQARRPKSPIEVIVISD
jgi:hypothetical protein